MAKNPGHSFMEFVLAVSVAEKDVHRVGSALITERFLADHANTVCGFGAMMNADEPVLEHRTTILTIVIAFFHSVRAFCACQRCVLLLSHFVRFVRSPVVEGEEMTRK
jgi:hypothetical protein